MDLFQAIEEQDISLIRRRLSTYAMANPNDEQAILSRALTMIEQRNIALWDEQDTFLRKEKKDWDQDYLTEAYAFLKTEQYSKALFFHVIELGRYLSPVQKPNHISERKPSSMRQNPMGHRVERLQQELTDLEEINRKKGFNQQEKHRFDEIRKELDGMQSTHQIKDGSKRSPFMEMLTELLNIVRQILNTSKGR